MEETKKAEQLNSVRLTKCRFCSWITHYDALVGGEKKDADERLRAHTEEKHKEKLEEIKKWAEDTAGSITLT